MSKRDEKTLQVVEPVEAIKAHPSRARKKFAGELIQMDASVELWFGNTKTYLHARLMIIVVRLLAPTLIPKKR